MSSGRPDDGDDVLDAPVDVDALADELRAEVDARRARGEYPPGLEAELSGHLERISHAAHRPMAVDRLRERVADVAAAARALTAAAPEATSSKLPGGVQLHALVARLVQRHLQAVVDQQRAFATTVEAALVELVAAVEEPATHLHADLLERLDALEDRFAEIERSLSLRR